MIPLIVLSLTQPATRPLDLDRMLYCIRSLEDSKGDPRAVGPHGERGLYQFKFKTWRDITRLPFDKAFVPAYATPVARARLIEIKHQLASNHITVSPYNVALCWRIGIEGMMHDHEGELVRDYAQRAANLYADR
jgi:hypothetical protein